jgi:hypothetical protein
MHCPSRLPCDVRAGQALPRVQEMQEADSACQQCISPVPDTFPEMCERQTSFRDPGHGLSYLPEVIGVRDRLTGTKPSKNPKSASLEQAFNVTRQPTSQQRNRKSRIDKIRPSSQTRQCENGANAFNGAVARHAHPYPSRDRPSKQRRMHHHRSRKSRQRGQDDRGYENNIARTGNDEEVGAAVPITRLKSAHRAAVEDRIGQKSHGPGRIDRSQKHEHRFAGLATSSQASAVDCSVNKNGYFGNTTGSSHCYSQKRWVLRPWFGRFLKNT